MTTISTCLSIGFMPLNMYIYVRTWIAVSDIPFVDMIVTILVVWAAVILGHIVGRLLPKIVPFLTKVSAFAPVQNKVHVTCGYIQESAFS